jgi:hypothetical protein
MGWLLESVPQATNALMSVTRAWRARPRPRADYSVPNPKAQIQVRNEQQIALS